LCFFFRMRLRRFLINEPIGLETLSGESRHRRGDADISDPNPQRAEGSASDEA